jgi:hypothetical protein
MKVTVLIVLLLSAATGVSGGQVSQGPVGDLVRLLDKTSCAGNFQSGKVLCEIVLPRLVDARKSKSGEHILLPTYLTTSAAESPITTLDATITEVRSGVNGDSLIRIRIDKAVRGDGREIPVAARIVAIASPSSFIERWQFTGVIEEPFPRIPEDDERLPGEQKLPEDYKPPPDPVPQNPVRYRREICRDPAKKNSASQCTNSLEARGVYGYKKVTLEPMDSSLRVESALTSKRNIALRHGTVLVLEMENTSRPL